MRKTKSPPVQFRLLLDDYAILEELADNVGLTPKDYVIDLTLARINKHRKATATEAAS